MKKLVLIFAILFLISFVLIITIHLNITYHAKNATPQKADVIIVLGCQIWGYEPSWSLEYRLKKALQLYNDNYAQYIIVSGGQGKDEITSESSVMKAWLVSNDIDSSLIFEEDKSTNTYENINFSKVIMDQKKFKSAIIVSNDFHIFRSVRLAKKFGITAYGAPAPTVQHLKAYYHSREILSVIKSLLMDRV